MADRPLTRREALRITAVAGLSTAFGGGLAVGVLREARLHRVSETRTRMGTVVTLTAVHPDAGAARDMIRAGFGEMARLEGLLSRHRRDTPVGRLNATGRLHEAPAELLAVLREAGALAAASGGAFDPTVAPLLGLYERAFTETGRPPRDEDIRAARALVDHRGVSIDGRAIAFARPGMSITLDGIAKGFIVDRTIDVLVGRGAERVLVDAGGDMATGGSGSSADPWTVAVQDPHRERGSVGVLRLGGECIATSGDYMRSFTLDRRFHHIVDPRTGRSPEALSSVSVVAPSAMVADGLSTTLMVLGPERGLELLARYEDAEGLVVTKTGERLRSEGFGDGMLAGMRV